MSGSRPAQASRERRIAREDEATSDMATEAAKRALKDANLTAADIDLIIVATITPDMFFPATACLVQEKIGARMVPGIRCQRCVLRFYLRSRDRQSIHKFRHL